MNRNKYYREEMLEDYAIGNVCIVVFQDDSAEVGYLMETSNLPLKDRVCVHRSSKYCVLPLNPMKGKYFFSLKWIKEIVYVSNRYILPHTRAEQKKVWKKIETNCIGECINNTMSYEKFRMLLEEANKE